MKKLLPLVISATLGSVSLNAFAESLVQIYDVAKQNDPQLLRTQAQRDAAFEAITSSRSSLLPQISLAASYTLTRGKINPDTGPDRDNDDNVANIGLNLTQELYDRSSWITLDTAEMTARQADATLAVTEQSLILRVAQGYFSVLSAQDNLEFIRAEKTAVGRQLEQTKQRFEVGLSAITDVHDAQAQYDSVLASEILAENTLANSYETLREITGRSYQNLDVLDTKRFSAVNSTTAPEQLINEAQVKNLSLLAQRIAVDIARENISLASSAHLPTLDLVGGYSISDTSDSTVNNGISNDGRANGFNIGVQLAVPLYQGGRIDSLTKQAEFNYVASAELLEETYRSVSATVRAQQNNINANIGAIRAYEQTVISARSALEANEAGFEVGTRTIVDVLDATQSLYDANRNLSNARYNYILSQLQLAQAVGTLSEQNLVDVDAGLIPAK
ncbi:outer membrane channel protein TolC [Vibrio sp. SM6]|uniref:Outer membrane channel protein TolC n=1 Tax=Vibrio agarilyticus TaxID=2726741 RepID=A0A7X8TP29_9VIBR|nr:outer membrane channel protein TolC [Vibrio agarilyticus]NLS12327.1 outer membrane channel protein TolC [Vibrio agarilyticus]